MLQVHAIPAFDDNYLWVLENGREAVVVDPGDAAPVAAFLDARGLSLGAILLTHHHGDHVGGVSALAARGPCPVIGPRGDAIAGLTRRVGEGDRVELPGLGIALGVIDVPGHTAGHVAYAGDLPPEHPGGEARPVVFCGDTLFAGGCGRLFEGTPATMHASLAKLAGLGAETLVYCAHEYTLANLRFAQAVEPGNDRLRERLARDRATREAGRPTVPSTIALERDTNPFLRAAVPEVAAAASRRAGRPLADAVEVFATLRSWKNEFR